MTENGGRRVEDGELRLEQEDLIEKEHLELNTEDGGLWIEDRPSRFDDFIMPHHHLIYVFLLINCCESLYFEDIVGL